MANGYGVGVSVSVCLHALLIAALVHGWEARSREPSPMPKFVQARLVALDSAAVKQQAPAPAPDRQRRQREQEQERRRKAEADRARRAAIEREKQRKAEQQRRQRAAEKRAREEKAQREIERQEQLERERRSAFDEALKEEQDLQAADINARAVASVAQAIRQRIEAVWNRPPSARNGMVTEVRISFVPTGRVVASNITKSSGNAALDRSVLTAIRKVEVFPAVAQLARKQPLVFERQVRTTQLIFRVEGLRQ